jgi:hypothetical protein
MSKFISRRIVRQHTMKLPDVPGRIFPLLCPVMERQWLQGWDCTMVYSETGLAEKNCVFTTEFPGDGHVVWVVSLYDPDNHRIEFAQTAPGSRVVKLEIRLKESHGKQTTAQWTYTYTALTEAGNEYLNHVTEDVYNKKMIKVEESLAHYLKTGEMLIKDWE